MQIPVLSNGRFYVYEHCRADSGAVFYVGKGTGDRAYNASRYHRNRFWQNVVVSAGGFSVRFAIKDVDEELSFFVEQEIIHKHRMCGIRLCNLTDGGEGTSGWEKSEECRKKIGDAHRGKVLSEETRKKISESVKASGYIHTGEVKRKISDAHKGQKRSLGYKHTEEWKKANSLRMLGNKLTAGKKHSDEVKRKMSEAHKGRAQSKITCPRCGKSGGNTMRRWHFDRCNSMSETP